MLGVADEQTKMYMRKERCGMPDFNRVNITLSKRRKRYVLQGKCHKNHFAFIAFL